MNFEFTRAAWNHAALSVLMSLPFAGLLLALDLAPAVSVLFGSGFYTGREVTDLQKRHNWNLRTWNSAELALPLVACGLAATALYHV